MAEGVLKNSKKNKSRTAATTAAKTAELWKHDQVVFGEEQIQHLFHHDSGKAKTRCTAMLRPSSRRNVIGCSVTELEFRALFFRRDYKNGKKLSFIAISLRSKRFRFLLCVKKRKRNSHVRKTLRTYPMETLATQSTLPSELHTYCLCKRIRTGLNSFLSLALSVPVFKNQLQVEHSLAIRRGYQNAYTALQFLDSTLFSLSD